MELYGEYEVVRQIPRVATSRIFTLIARKRNGPADTEFVIRVFPPSETAEAASPQAADLDELSVSGRLAFLESIQQQKLACDAGARNLAPIHEFQNDSRGVWYVTNLYPRGTLKKLIVGQYQADDEDVYHLVESVLTALLDLKKYCGRSHGNLVPNSILLGGREGKRLQHAPVFVYEPLAGDAGKSAAYELADLHAIGEIIFQLVRRREIRAVTQWPLHSSEEWTRLGKQGEQWRELCNRLVDPQVTLRVLDLEKLRSELAGLRPAVSPHRALWTRMAGPLAKLRPGPWLARIHPVARPQDQPVEPAQRRPLWSRNTLIAGGLVLALMAAVTAGRFLRREKQAPATVSSENPSVPTATAPPPQEPSPTPLTGSLELTSDPQGAEIFQDGTSLHTTTPQTLTGLNPGTVTYELRVPGYEAYMVSANVEVHSTATVAARLVPLAGAVELSSIPPGAEIIQDGKSLGKTVKKLSGLAPGVVSFGLSLDGYEPTNVTVVVKAQETVQQEVQLQPLDTSVPVLVTTDPRGANISVDGRLIGPTPLTQELRLPPGVHELTAQYQDWPEQKQRLVVESGTPAIATFDFVASSLEIDSDPAGADVWENNKKIGATPLVIPNLKFGVASYDLHAEGYLPVTVTTNIVPGQRITLRQHLLRLTEGAELILTSNLEHVEFIVNGQSLGTPKIPVYVAVAPGTYEVSARFRDWAPIRQTAVTLPAGKSSEIPFTFPLCRNILDSDPPGATVFMGTRRIGVTPCTNSVSPSDVVATDGQIVYRFELDGFAPKTVKYKYTSFHVTVSDFDKSTENK